MCRGMRKRLSVIQLKFLLNTLVETPLSELIQSLCILLLLAAALFVVNRRFAVTTGTRCRPVLVNLARLARPVPVTSVILLQRV